MCTSPGQRQQFPQRWHSYQGFSERGVVASEESGMSVFQFAVSAEVTHIPAMKGKVQWIP
jgi:hypothetical protein